MVTDGVKFLSVPLVPEDFQNDFRDLIYRAAVQAAHAGIKLADYDVTPGEMEPITVNGVPRIALVLTLTPKSDDVPASERPTIPKLRVVGE